VAGQGLKGFAGQAHDAPFGEDAGADFFVDGDGGGVPAEDVPLEAGAALVDGDTGEVGEKGFADSLPSLGRGDVEVFEANAVVAEPGGVAGEVETEAGRYGLAVLFELGDDAMEAGGGAEAVAEQVGLGGEDGLGFALVDGQLADEAEDLGDVGRVGGADFEHALDRVVDCGPQRTGNGSAAAGPSPAAKEDDALRRCDSV
jgi:hypothetical protein